MKDGNYIHYQLWNPEHPVALKFRFTEIGFTVEGLKTLKKEIEDALKIVDNGNA